MRLKVSHRLAVPKFYDFFNRFSLTLRFDSLVSAFGFDFYFDYTNKEHAELFAVSHFHEAIVEHNGKTLVTGFMLAQRFKATAQKQLVSIGGYTKTGVLEDCQIPPSVYPLQINGLTLTEIANKLCAPFKLKVIVDPDVASKMNERIQSTTLEATSTVKDILVKLAVQRKLLITHDVNGNVYFTKVKTNKKPLFELTDSIPGTSIELMFDGQKLHSDITVMKEASSDGGNAGEYTIENPFVPVAYTYRPRVATQSSGDDVTIQEYAKQLLLSEIKSAITLTITTDRWEVNGIAIEPNNIISVYNPEVYLYKKQDWFIEEVTFTGEVNKTVATLKCVLPCVYDETTPKNIFVDAHENFPRFAFTKNNNSQSAFI